MGRPWFEGPALPELPALLVDGEIEVRLKRARLGEVVLQPDRQAHPMSEVRQGRVVLQLCACADREPRVVLIGVHVVELDGVHADQPRLLHAGEPLVQQETPRGLPLARVGVDPRHVRVDVQPVFVGEVAERIPE